MFVKAINGSYISWLKKKNLQIYMVLFLKIPLKPAAKFPDMRLSVVLQTSASFG